MHGRELVLTTMLDDELSNNQQRALEIVSANDTFAVLHAPRRSPAGWADIAEAGIPLYTWGIHPAEIAGRESIFGYNGRAVHGVHGPGRCRTPARSSAPRRSRRSATACRRTPRSAPSPRRRASSCTAPRPARRSAYTNPNLAFGLPNGIAPEVTAMRDAGVDFITACIDLNGMKTLAQELERQGMGDVPMQHPNTYDAAFVAEAGDLFEGDYVLGELPAVRGRPRRQPARRLPGVDGGDRRARSPRSP